MKSEMIIKTALRDIRQKIKDFENGKISLQEHENKSLYIEALKAKEKILYWVLDKGVE